MKPTEQEIKLAAEAHKDSLDWTGISKSILMYKQVSFEQGANWAISQMQPEWVPLKMHHLPESEKYYSIWRKGYSPEETIARLTFHDGFNTYCFIDNSMNLYTIGKIVTHYKPLSQPPTK